ncbi:hypothetical protein CEE45_07955 [Candidatus Heimdallarchaeota archaeon B3_Heim]|nr:MAG: hypothetical protein CEE45_07955 [Candidatus Heimdallarchaeota archaeon B3_Heim]
MIQFKSVTSLVYSFGITCVFDLILTVLYPEFFPEKFEIVSQIAFFLAVFCVITLIRLQIFLTDYKFY